MRFDLEDLGWRSFQDLALAIAQHSIGLAVETFSLGPDGGRDGAALVLGSSGKPESWGKVAIQSKHTASATRLLVKHVRPEFSKVRSLVRSGLCDTYLLFTNRPLSARVEGMIVSHLEELGVKHSLIIGREAIERFLTEDKVLRGLVPRMYGLGDLSEIIDERLYAQTQVIVFDDDLDRFVTTDPYFETLQALAHHSFALLLGEPASGKSSIMRAASIHAADRWGIAPMWLSSMVDFREHWNPARDDQLFLLDDAFGSTAFDPETAELWNRSIPVMRAAIRKGAKFITTSRDYIFAAAKDLLKRDDLPVAREGEVVIDVKKLSTAERRQIVYNHIRLGNQPLGFKTAIKPHLLAVTHSPRFLPEIARRLGDQRFTQDLNPQDIHAVRKFVEEPRAYLLGVIDGLSRPLQAALVILLANGGVLPNPLPMDRPLSDIASRLDVDRYRLGRSLEELDGSLVRYTHLDGCGEWRTRHPTVLDAIGDWLYKHADLIDLYVEFAPLESLARQVSCGATLLGSLSVPQDLWPTVFDRFIRTPKATTTSVRFLAYRCSSSALRSVGRMDEIVELVERRGFRTPLDSDPSTRLLLRLAGQQLVDPDTSNRLLSQLVDAAIRTFDPYCVLNPVVDHLMMQASGGERGLANIVGSHLIAAERSLSSEVETRISTDLGHVDRADQVSELVALIDNLLEWTDESSAVAQLLREERTRIAHWVDLDGLATMDPKHRREQEERVMRMVRSIFAVAQLPTQKDVDVFSDVDDS